MYSRQSAVSSAYRRGARRYSAVRGGPPRSRYGWRKAKPSSLCKKLVRKNTTFKYTTNAVSECPSRFIVPKKGRVLVRRVDGKFRIFPSRNIQAMARFAERHRIWVINAMGQTDPIMFNLINVARGDPEGVAM